MMRTPGSQTSVHGLIFTLVLSSVLSACGDRAVDEPEPDPTASGGAAAELDIPERPFQEPTGPYEVGTMEVTWVDEARPEPFTKDPQDRRSVAARIWYPAASGGAGDAPYFFDLGEFGDGDDFTSATHMKTHATLDAPASTDGPFPVVVYNHGGSWTRFTSTFTTEELSSHGYVVVSVGHNGFNKTHVLEGGASVKPDTLMFPDPTGDLLADAYGSWDFLDESHFPEWVADAVYALDQLGGMNTSGPLAGALDVENIGMYGWSFGGATSIEALATDPRVKAAIDHDGQLFGSAPRAGTSRPFMLMHGGETPDAPPSEDPEEAAALAAAIDELMGVVRATDASFKAASTGDWYDITIAGTNHGSFSDLTLVLPGSSPGIDPVRAHQIINALTLAFFDRYLKGSPSPLLEDPAAEFPEITFERRVQS